MHHLYLSLHNNATALQQEREALEGWCEKGGVKDYKILEEKLTAGRISQRFGLKCAFFPSLARAHGLAKWLSGHG